MSASIDGWDVERFRTALTRLLGLAFDDAKLAALAELLPRRAALARRSTSAYLSELEAGMAPPREVRDLVCELTVPETYFFRHAAQFQAFAEEALPRRLAARGGIGPVHIVSAGCASGEEAYSLVITMIERGLDPGRDAFVRAVDGNAAMLHKAARARYSEWALRETTDALRARWFAPVGKEITIDPRVRDAVAFEERNLAAENADLWATGAYDVIFCRNVLMYFAPASIEALVARMARALAPGGFLFLGHAESLRGVSDDFHLRQAFGAFFYERKSGADRASASHVIRARASELPPRTAPPDPDPMDRPARAGVSRWPRRESAPSGPAATPQPAATSRSGAIESALEPLAAGRFADALEILEPLALEDSDPTDARGLVVLAVALTHLGQLARAERACVRLGEIDDRGEHQASAYHVLALCREGQGDDEGAREHDRRAATLDPTFAMPHLHLGLLARRAGDAPAAKSELERAVSLLGSEDSARVLLFGGGFGRDGLIAVCRAELARLRGTP